MIRLHQVEKRYPGVHAVKGVTLSIEPGQIVGVLGPNGAGKTTTIRMIAGLLPPSAGTVSVNKLDSVADSLALRAHIGYMPESAPLYPEMKAASYLRYRAGLYSLRGRAARDSVERVIDRCRLTEMRDRRIGTLSKGYRQRVGLASALLHDPAVVILDEPTSGLDPAQVVESRSLIRELAGRRTMLVVSHILPEVEKTCDRIIVFARGRVRADGAPSELISKESRGLDGAAAAERCVVEVRTSTPGAPRIPAALTAIPDVERIDITDAGAGSHNTGWTRCVLTFANNHGDARERVFAACVAAGLTIRELRHETASLEEFYIRLVERADAEHLSQVGGTGVPPVTNASRDAAAEGAK
ncbi:MAG: ABC transporter ATP-binding protein [Phycisphaerales bacterium]